MQRKLFLCVWAASSGHKKIAPDLRLSLCDANKCRGNPFPVVVGSRSSGLAEGAERHSRVIYSRVDVIAKIASQGSTRLDEIGRNGEKRPLCSGQEYRETARERAARDEPIGVRLKYKMGFEDSDGVTRRFNYCRPGATYNFCHRPIAAFHLPPSPPALPFVRTYVRGSSVRPFVSPFVGPSVHPPALLDFSALPDRRPIFSRERRFFSALLPEPQNGAKMRYRFAEPGLAADLSADLVPSPPSPFFTEPSPPLPPARSSPVRTIPLVPWTSIPKRERVFSISILCSRDERRALAAIARESPLDGVTPAIMFI